MREYIFFHFFRRFYASFDARAGQLYTIIMTLHKSVALVEKTKKIKNHVMDRDAFRPLRGFFFFKFGDARQRDEMTARHFFGDTTLAAHLIDRNRRNNHRCCYHHIIIIPYTTLYVVVFYTNAIIRVIIIVLR